MAKTYVKTPSRYFMFLLHTLLHHKFHYGNLTYFFQLGFIDSLSNYATWKNAWTITELLACNDEIQQII